MTSMFDFLLKLHVMEYNDIEIKAKNLVEIYSNDLDTNFCDELKHFIPLIKINSDFVFNQKESKNISSLNALKILNWIVKSDMVDVFPNINIAYRIYVTIPIANSGAERLFSTLKRVKDVYRAEMLDGIDFEEVINNFAAQKCRRKC